MFTRLTHGLGAVALVTLTSGVLVYTAGPAQAAGEGALADVFQPVLKLVPALGGGEGIAAAAPELVAGASAVCATGVGCAVLAVGAVAAIGLVATHDIWVPWLRNGFGASSPGTGVDSGGQYGHFTVTGYTDAGQIVVHGSTWAGAFVSNVLISTTCTYTPPAGSGQPPITDTHGYAGVHWDGDAMGKELDFPIAGCGASAAYPAGSSVHLDSLRAIDDNGYLSVLNWTNGTARDPMNTASQIKVECTRPDGTSYEVIGMTQLGNGDAVQPSCVGAAGLAAGGVQGSRGKCVTLSGGLAGALGLMTDLSTNCAAADQAAVLYPNCVGGGVACTYVVRVNGLPCAIGGLGCANWPALAEANPGSYECFYGPYAVALAACGLLERAYEPINGTNPLTATQLNTDGDPRTHDGPVPAINPPTSPRVPASSTAPATDPNAPKPCTSGQACAVSPTSGADCFPSGFGAFNPATWVLQPIKCALSWAFVPSSLFMNGWSDGIKGEWASSPFGQWLAPLSGFGTLHIASGGCEGPALPTGFLGEGLSNGVFHVASPAVLPAVLHPFSACADPMAGVARTSNMILTAGIAFYGGMKVIRQLGYAFGFQIHVGSERSTFT